MEHINGFALTRAAHQVLLKQAAVTSEGEIETEGKNDARYYGSTLLTIDLDSDAIDAGPGSAHPEMIAALARTSLLFRIQLLRLARLEAERRTAPYLLRGMSAETQFRIDNHRLLVDINIECLLADPAVGGVRHLDEGRR